MIFLTAKVQGADPLHIGEHGSIAALIKRLNPIRLSDEITSVLAWDPQ